MNAESPFPGRPPRWAEAVLMSLLKPGDRESVPGDLLEEYREARRPAGGAFRANVWYLVQVVSMLWRLIWPCALVMAGLSALMGLKFLIDGEFFKPLFYGSLVPAPGLSFVHALIYWWAGYHASRQTGLIATGVIAAMVTSFIGLAASFMVLTLAHPDLLVALFVKPFIFVILSVFLLMALCYSAVAGSVGGAIGKRLTPTAPEDVRAS